MKNTPLPQSDTRLIEHFVSSLQQQNKSAHTIKNYRSDIEHFCRWLRTQSPKKLAHVGPSDIQNYSQYLSAKTVSTQPRKKWQRIFVWFWGLITLKFQSTKLQLPLRLSPMAVASRRRHLSSLKNFFEFHCQSHSSKYRGFQKNPVRTKLHAIGLKDKDVQHTKMLTQEHFEKLLEAATKIEQRLALWILYDGALRLEELSRLKFESFHSPSQTLRFVRKGGNWHTLKLEHFSKIYELLVAHQQKIQGSQESNDDWVFKSRQGQALTPRSHYNRLKRLFIKAGLPQGLSPHSFRKGRATQLYSQTKDLLYVRDYLNHRDAKVTQTYIDTQYLYS